MAFLETVRHWNEGVLAFQEQRFQDALLCFNHILDPSARIHFNLACVLKRLGKETECILHLGEALTKDPHLAVAYFHRSVQLLKTKKYDEAMIDLDRAEKSLRGATFINYNQLGLNFTLYRFEIDFNRAVCVAMKGDLRTAIHMLIEAGKTAEEEIHNRISVSTIQDLTLCRQDGRQGSLPSSFKEFEIPQDGIFQPPKDMVANIEKKQYVAKAKVVTRSYDFSNNMEEKESKPSFSSMATKVPPIPRRPLPPPPTEIKHAKSAENLVAEVKDENSHRRKLSMDNNLLNALNARFKNSDINSSPEIPKKMSVSPSRPPRRPPPPSAGKSLPSNVNSPPVPSKPSRTMSSPSNSTSRNIPPPPSYKPPPPPPTFKPPSPPVKQSNLPALPPKVRSRHT